MYDAIIVGGGPAGLSAALNLGRARARVLLVDADRPRNAATLNSHGFLTRDGIAPSELRRLARAELEAYPDVEIHTRVRVSGVTRIDADEARFAVTLTGRGAPERAETRSLIIATGLRETLPALPGILSFYGTTLFSCAACDAWEMQDQRLGLFGETDDLADRARLIARWTHSLTVFTNGAPVITEAEATELTDAGIVVERRRITEIEGEKTTVSSVLLEDGLRIPLDGGFVRPVWDAPLDILDELHPETDDAGHLVTDRSGRTSVAGLYAAGDIAAPGPQQLIVAAGQGARAAAVLIHDLVGVETAH